VLGTKELAIVATASDHVANPRHAGTLPDADAVGVAGVPGQGNYMVLYVKRKGDRILDVRFQTYGCPAAIASGSWVAEWILGKTLSEVARLESSDIESGLDGLPIGKEHCAPLAVRAVRWKFSKQANQIISIISQHAALCHAAILAVVSVQQRETR